MLAHFRCWASNETVLVDTIGKEYYLYNNKRKHIEAVYLDVVSSEYAPSGFVHGAIYELNIEENRLTYLHEPNDILKEMIK